MKKKISITTIIISGTLISAYFLVDCNYIQHNNIEIPNDTTKVKEFTNMWNECIVKQDFSSLSKIYAEQVSFYGKKVLKEQVITSKKDFLKKYSDFNQSITGEIKINKYDDLHYRAQFTKRTNFNSKSSDVQAYLDFVKVNDIWMIINESDYLTDENLSNIVKKKCTEIALEILKTSPWFLQMTKGYNEGIIRNGGTSYGILIEASPNPKIDNALRHSNNYEFNLHECYQDRILVVARFVLKPDEKQLFYYDVVEDKLKPINANKSLLEKLKKLCCPIQ